jgi:hypothetical protein
MLASSIPTKIAIPFASGAGAAFVRAIPATATTPGQASFSAGFPPVTFLPDTAGGINPDGRDFNGILQACTAWLQWLNAGGPVAYDDAFSASIGGYPKGAMLSNATTPGLFWISSADSNTTNPDSSGSVNWIGFPTAAIAVETARAQGVEATKAALAGSASQVFNVANAVTATEAVALGQFGALAASSGYQRLPGGVIVQWGTNAVGAPSSVTFPIAFPNACLCVVVNEGNANSGAWGAARPTVHGAQSFTTSGYTAWAESWSGSGWTSGSITQCYIAIGY